MNTSGGLTNNGAWSSTQLILVKGNCLFVQGSFSNLAGAGLNIGLFAADYSFIKGYTCGDNTGANKGQYFDVSGASYVRFSNATSSVSNNVYGFFYSGLEDAVFNKLSRTVTPSFSVAGYLQTNGTVKTSASDWGTTPLIPVSDLAMYLSGRWYSLSGAGYNVCLYNKDGAFLRGYNPGGEDSVYDVSDAAFVRLSSHDPYLSISATFFYPNPSETREVIVDVNGGGEYTSLLAALKATPATTPIRLRPGTYDLIAEYEAFYGADFFTNYEGYSGVSDPFYRGLWLDRGRKIRGDAGAVIRCVYTGSNSSVVTLFSAIANAGSILLENVTLEHGNLRYAIHDDYGAINETIEFRKIRFIGHSNGAPIGAGLGLNTTVIIEDCVFEGNRQRWDINYHGSNSAGASNVNKIYVTNCKGNKGFGIWPNGSATTLSTAFVSNSKFSEITCYRPDGQDASQTMNVELVEWNNTVDE